MPSGYGDMIAWANGNTPNTEVKNLQSSWSDGFALLDLFNSFVPGWVDISNVEKGLPPPGHAQRAFDLFEAKLGVPQMLLPQQLQASPIDKTSVYAYLSTVRANATKLAAGDSHFIAARVADAAQLRINQGDPPLVQPAPDANISTTGHPAKPVQSPAKSTSPASPSKISWFRSADSISGSPGCPVAKGTAVLAAMGKIKNQAWFQASSQESTSAQILQQAAEQHAVPTSSQPSGAQPSHIPQSTPTSPVQAAQSPPPRSVRQTCRDVKSVEVPLDREVLLLNYKNNQMRDEGVLPPHQEQLEHPDTSARVAMLHSNVASPPYPMTVSPGSHQLRSQPKREPPKDVGLLREKLASLQAKCANEFQRNFSTRKQSERLLSNPNLHEDDIKLLRLELSAAGWPRLMLQKELHELGGLDSPGPETPADLEILISQKEKELRVYTREREKIEVAMSQIQSTAPSNVDAASWLKSLSHSPPHSGSPNRFSSPSQMQPSSPLSQTALKPMSMSSPSDDLMSLLSQQEFNRVDSTQDGHISKHEFVAAYAEEPNKIKPAVATTAGHYEAVAAAKRQEEQRMTERAATTSDSQPLHTPDSTTHLTLSHEVEGANAGGNSTTIEELNERVARIEKVLDRSGEPQKPGCCCQ